MAAADWVQTGQEQQDRTALVSSQHPADKERPAHILIKRILKMNLLRLHLFRFSVKDKIRSQRISRLVNDLNVLPLKSTSDLSRIRNIGIIAHIDAGKTTTTEMMLLVSGALSKAGRVDHGDTVMDFLPQQRQRGITIRSAAISFNWKDHQINLIDTPGHVDFQGQVHRALRVLDGAITVLDSINGVQSQSERVWKQASSNLIPKLIFINKMDRQSASLQFNLNSIRSKFKCTPLCLQLPVFQQNQLKSIIDLVNMEITTFYKQLSSFTESLKQQSPLFSKAKSARQALIEQLANFNNEVADKYLNQQKISPKELTQYIRGAFLKNHQRLAIVLLGSALKCKGIQYLLEAVTTYLPSPPQRPELVCSKSNNKRKPAIKQKLLLYCFKILLDKQHGDLALCRLFSGTLKKNSILFNTNKQTIAPLNKVFRVRANQLVRIDQTSAGDIVALAGMPSLQAGTTLVLQGQSAFHLQNLKIPSPVFYSAITVKNSKDSLELQKAVYQLIKEDSSLQVRRNQHSGQLLIGGLGQLHLQVFTQRIKTQRKIECRLQKVQIAFQQQLQSQYSIELRVQKMFKGKPVFLELELQFIKSESPKVNVIFEFSPVNRQFQKNYKQFVSRSSSKNKKSDANEDEVPIQPTTSNIKFLKNPYKPVQKYKISDQHGQHSVMELSSMPLQQLYQLQQSLLKTLSLGKFNYPIVKTSVIVKGGVWCNDRNPVAAVVMAAVQLKSALTKMPFQLSEPISSFLIQGKIQQQLVSEIMLKRGSIEERGQDRLSGKIPFAQTLGYDKIVKSRGLQLSLKMSDYQPVKGKSVDDILKGQK